MSRYISKCIRIIIFNPCFSIKTYVVCTLKNRFNKNPKHVYRLINKKLTAIFTHNLFAYPNLSRLRAKKGPAPPPTPPPLPPLGNFADISYLEENFKPHLLRDVCTLCSGALVSDSLLHMLLKQTKEKIKMKV